MHGFVHSNKTNTVIRSEWLSFCFLDAKKRYIVLVMNYKVMPRDAKADLTELVSIILENLTLSIFFFFFLPSSRSNRSLNIP